MVFILESEGTTVSKILTIFSFMKTVVCFLQLFINVRYQETAVAVFSKVTYDVNSNTLTLQR